MQISTNHKMYYLFLNMADKELNVRCTYISIQKHWITKIWKWKFGHRLLAFMPFQTCITFSSEEQKWMRMLFGKLSNSESQWGPKQQKLSLWMNYTFNIVLCFSPM